MVLFFFIESGDPWGLGGVDSAQKPKENRLGSKDIAYVVKKSILKILK